MILSNRIHQSGATSYDQREDDLWVNRVGTNFITF